MNRADAYATAVYFIGTVAFIVAVLVVLSEYVIDTGYGWKVAVWVLFAGLTILIGEIIYAKTSGTQSDEEPSRTEEPHA